MPLKYLNESEINREVARQRGILPEKVVIFFFWFSFIKFRLIFRNMELQILLLTLFFFITFETQTRCKIILQLGMENPLQIELQEFSELLNYSQPNSPG